MGFKDFLIENENRGDGERSFIKLTIKAVVI